MPKTKTLSAQEQLKQLCPLLAAIGVTRVEATYDGSGDSGDFQDIAFCFTDTVAQHDGHARDATTNGRRMYLDEFRRMHTTAENAIMPTPKLEEFVEALWQLLPGGWEIDEGSYGDITIDTARAKLKLVHNERIVETNTSTEEW